MAEVVELFGAPGTGKSSLARALDGRRVAGRRLVAAERLLWVPRDGLLGRLGRFAKRERTPAERRAALGLRRGDWAELLELIADAPLGRERDGATGTAVDPLRALHAPGWLADSLELRALAATAPDTLVVVIEEGILQRTPVLLGHDPTPAELDRLARALPPTLLHLRLTADTDMLLRRLRSRTRVIDRHAGLDSDALAASVAADDELYGRAAEALAKAGVAVADLGTDGDEQSLAADAERRIVAALR